MQSITTTSPGVVAPWAVLWTGDVEFTGICAAMVYFSCCQYGISLRWTYTNIGGGGSTTGVSGLCQTTTCYNSSGRVTLDVFSSNRRLTKVEYQVESANLCQKDTPVKFKLAFDVTVGGPPTINPCLTSFDNVQIV